MKKNIYSVGFGWIIIYIASHMVNYDIIYYSKDIKDLFIGYFSFLPINSQMGTITLVIPVAHMIFVVYMFSTYILDDIKHKGAIIFTRTDKKEKWIIKEYIEILMKLSIYFLIQFIFFLILGFLNNMNIIKINEFINTVFALFILQVLSAYILIVLSNLISLFGNAIYGYLTSIIGLMINITVLDILYSNRNFIIKYLPFTQHLILFNDLNFIDRNIPMFNYQLNGYILPINITISILLIITLIYLSIIKMKKIDILA